MVIVMLDRARFVPWKLVDLVFFVVLSVASAQAELTWKTTSAELHADAKTPVLEARFPFVNKGSSPVDITQVESSCGCTTVALEKRHYDPGESGEIAAKYTVGDQAGLQKKTVKVLTNDGHAPVVLALNIHIPEVLRIQPVTVNWNHGESSTPKKITLEMLQDVPVKDLSVQSTAAAFVADVISLVPGHKYELSVRPVSTDQHQFSTLNIRCRIGGEEKVFRAYATVRPALIKE